MSFSAELCTLVQKLEKPQEEPQQESEEFWAWGAAPGATTAELQSTGVATINFHPPNFMQISTEANCGLKTYWEGNSGKPSSSLAKLTQGKASTDSFYYYLVSFFILLHAFSC